MPGFSVDDLIKGTLAILPDCEARHWPAPQASVVHIIKTAPVVSMPMILDFDPVKAKQLLVNDNLRIR